MSFIRDFSIVGWDQKGLKSQQPSCDTFDCLRKNFDLRLHKPCFINMFSQQIPMFFLNLDIFLSFLSFLHFSTKGRISGCIPFRDPAGATSGPGRYQAGEGPLGISRFFLCPLKAPKTGLTSQDEIPLPRMRGALNVTRRGRARRRSAVRSRPFWWVNPPDIFSDLPSLRCTRRS